MAFPNKDRKSKALKCTIAERKVSSKKQKTVLRNQAFKKLVLTQQLLSPTVSASNPASPTVSALNPPSPTVSALNPPSPTVSALNPPSPTVSALNPPSPTVSASNPPSPSAKRTCKRCEKPKHPVEDFYSGRAVCKDCVSEGQRRKREENLEQKRELLKQNPSAKQTCTECEEPKHPIEDFHSGKTVCKDCVSKERKRKCEENLEQKRELLKLNPSAKQTCTECEEDKHPVDDFSSGRAVCKDCFSEGKKRKRKESLETAKQLRTQYPHLERTCTECELDKSLFDSFSPLSNVCKDCVSEGRKRRKLEEKSGEYSCTTIPLTAEQLQFRENIEKECGICQLTKKGIRFHLCRSAKDLCQGYCIECCRDIQRSYRAMNNPEKNAITSTLGQLAIEFSKAGSEMTRLGRLIKQQKNLHKHFGSLNNVLTRLQWKKYLEQKSIIAGRYFTFDQDDITLDHIIPKKAFVWAVANGYISIDVALAVFNHWSNIQLLPFSENASKGATVHEDFDIVGEIKNMYNIISKNSSVGYFHFIGQQLRSCQEKRWFGIVYEDEEWWRGN